MQGEGMLVVSFSSVNYGFWYHLGCSGWKAHQSITKLRLHTKRSMMQSYCVGGLDQPGMKSQTFLLKHHLTV